MGSVTSLTPRSMRRIIIVILTIVALAVLISAHVWLWEAFVFLFTITSPTTKLVLGIVMGIFAVGFLPATYFVHVRENRLTTYFYTVMATWLGLALYVAMATVVAVVLLWIFDWEAHREMVAIICYTIALGYTGYGMWNAQYPRIIKISLPADQYPASWKGRTFVQLSDVHLGVIHHIQFMRRVVNMVKPFNPDVVFVTGDLYDGVGRELGLMAQPLTELEPPMGIYYITGNHETYVGLDRVFAAIKDLPLRPLRDEIVDLDGVQVLGMDYHLPGQKRDLRPFIDRLDRARPSIVLYHEPVPEIIEYCREHNVQLFLSGHTHKGQLWPFGAITRQMYGRFHWGLSHAGNMTVYTSTGVGSWGPPMRTGNHPQIIVYTVR